MSTNRITLIRGTAKTLLADLVDQDGLALTPDRLVDAVGTCLVRNDPAGGNVLAFTTPDPTHLVFIGSQLSLSFVNGDTSGLPLGTYTYQLQVTLADATTFIVIAWTPLYLTLGGSAGPSPPVFDNTIKVTHDWELPDTLTYQTPGGDPICDAQIRLFFKADYDAGNLIKPVGITTTTAYGRWKDPIFVVPGYSYVVQFFKPNEYGPDIRTILA